MNTIGVKPTSTAKPTDGNRDHEEAKASNQDPKPMNQELKDAHLLFGSPRPDRGAGCLPTGV